MACERCRKKKVKCDNKRPCFNCIASQSKCIYKGLSVQPSEKLITYAGSFASDMDDVRRIVTNLKNKLSPNAPASLQKGIFAMNAELEQIQSHLYLNLDNKEIASYSGTKSIETEIIGKQSSSLNKFSDVFGNCVSQSVDQYFGVYSPLLYFSSTGISWIIKTLLTYSNDRATRETVFLFLRFVDISSDHFLNNIMITSISPFDFYAKVNSLQCGHDELLRHILTNISTFLDGDTNVLRLANFSNPSSGFVNAIHLIEEHHTVLNVPKIDFSFLKTFLEQDDVIFCLCLEYFQKSIFSPMYDIHILQGLVSLMKHRYWMDDLFALGRVICVMSRRGLDFGLNRWEYYFGENEDKSEECRKLWWEVYWWDRWYALCTGKPPLISEEITVCLFPKKVVELGVDDSMDCFTLIDSVEFNPHELGACSLFGYTFLAKLITRVFVRILYNPNFTDYRLFALPTREELNVTARKLEVEFLKIKKTFERAQEKLLPFLKVHYNNSFIFELYIHFEFAQVCCFQSMETLITKVHKILQGKEEPALGMYIKQSKLHSYETTVTIITDILNQNNLFCFFKYSWSIIVVALNFTSYFIENPKKDSLFHLSLICHLVGLYANLLSDYENIKFKGSNHFYDRLGYGTTTLCILVRICCQVYIYTHKVTIELLSKDLEKYGQLCANGCLMVLDVKCVWYRNITSGGKESRFRERILYILERKMDDFTNDRAVNTHDKLPPSNPNGSKIVNYGSLEDFVTLECLPELLDFFWNNNNL
ncbi:CPI_1c_G0030790.mRNA.1.CDS.1 [Saccharomyces cerevisiae]|nr:CPI_1c_G0030790.mRNA.1.CDS.1 [Saccharomyces cerevisiae]CAI7369627.1 CPI_1c_G0030790.mRNA.1.CDS.1 [Saccharomyces cerevisiae]